MKMSAYFKYYKLNWEGKGYIGENTNQWGKDDHRIRKWTTEDNRIERIVTKGKSKCAVSKWKKTAP